MHGKKAINNSIISILYKLIILVMGFITRKIFIVYIGEELLGLNSLYANLLELLSLADLGIGVAVQFQMYEPLVKKDYDKLSRILGATKKIYNAIGYFIIIAGILLSFFIRFLIKSTTYPMWFVRVSFIISVIGVALGYFFVHKRLFLYASEEIGAVNIIDLVAKVVTIALSLVLTIIFKNYFLYLTINALCGLLANIIVARYFEKKYPQIREQTQEVEKETKELTANLKNVIPMKLSNYVYNSTDNIVISKILGLTTVALYTNYMTIINGIMGIEYLYGNVMSSSFGNIIQEKDDRSAIYKYYLVFQYLQFVFTSFCFVTMSVICTPFISWWIGDHFIIPSVCFVLLMADFFIHSMYQPAYVMYGAAGKFSEDKLVTTISAVMNIIISVVMVLYIGLPGVIIGTLITDLYIWAVRTYQMVKGYFGQSLIRYVGKMMWYCSITAISLLATMWICSFVQADTKLLEVLIKGIVCAIIPNLLCLAATYRSNEFRMALGYMKNYLHRGA